MNVDILSPETNPREYDLALADALEHGEELRLGPTDLARCAEALRMRHRQPVAAA